MQMLLLLITLVFSGCASVVPPYPVKIENDLNPPIQFSIKQFKYPEMPKVDAMMMVRKKLADNGLIADEFVVKYLDNNLSSHYDDIKNRELPWKNYFGKVFNGSIGAFDLLAFRNVGMSKPGSEFGKLDLSADGAFAISGSLQSGYNDCSRLGHPCIYGQATASASFKGKIEEFTGVISGTLSRYSILLNAKRDKSVEAERDRIVSIREGNIPRLLNQIERKSRSMEVSIVDAIYNNIFNEIRNRYRPGSLAIGPTEALFNSNFETSKARLQRALGDFQYDYSKSIFIINKRYSAKGKLLKHVFNLSLFPDQENTVVQFHGSFDFVEDDLGGPTLYGKETYLEEMDNYKALVSKILNN